MVRSLTKYTDQFLNNFFKYLPYFGFLSALARPTPDFLKLRIFFFKSGHGCYFIDYENIRKFLKFYDN